MGGGEGVEEEERQRRDSRSSWSTGKWIYLERTRQNCNVVSDVENAEQM